MAKINYSHFQEYEESIPNPGNSTQPTTMNCSCEELIELGQRYLEYGRDLISKGDVMRGVEESNKGYDIMLEASKIAIGRLNKK